MAPVHDMDQHRIGSKSSKKSAAPITATSRLRNDYMRLKKDPVPYIVAEPNPSNILEWHYAVTGPPDTPYDGGFYHGKVITFCSGGSRTKYRWTKMLESMNWAKTDKINSFGPACSFYVCILSICVLSWSRSGFDSL